MSRKDEKKETQRSGPSFTSPPIVPAWPDITIRFDNIFDQFKQSFDELLAPFGRATPFAMEQTVRPTAVDVVDEGDHYKVVAELPGFTKDLVDIKVNKNEVVIRAEKKADKEQKEKNYLRRERSYSTVERRVSLPEEVLPQNVEGTMNNGILELKIPKKEPKPQEEFTKVQLK